MRSSKPLCDALVVYDTTCQASEFGTEWRLPASALFATCMSTSRLPALQYTDKKHVEAAQLKAGGVLYTPEWGKPGSHLVLLAPAKWRGWWRVGWFEQREIEGERVAVMGTGHNWNCFDSTNGQRPLAWELVTT